MADRMKPPFLGKAPVLSDKDLKALMEKKSPPRGGRVPSVSDQDLERLRKMLMAKRKNFKNGGAVLAGRGGSFKGIK